MGRFVARRLLQMVVVVIGVTFLIYAAVWAIPGDPFRYRCGDQPCPAAYVAAMHAKYNLDDPLPVQYGKYLVGVLHGDLGETPAQRQVSDQLRSTFPVTAKLAVLAIGFEISIGILTGVVAALRRGRFLDYLVLVSTLLVISIPVFVLGFLAQLVLGLQLEWFPALVGKQAPWGDLVLPALVLASLSLAYVSRLMRNDLGDSLRADYVRTATAKGLPRARVVGVHAMRNSLIPVLTFIGADFGALLGGAVVVEGIFNIRGVGGLIFGAISARESATVVGAVTVLVLVFLVANLLVDLLYAALDPRIRYE